jgi:hypothetical protein
MHALGARNFSCSLREIPRHWTRSHCLLHVAANVRGMVDAVDASMRTHAITLTIPFPDGQIATFSYDLAETQGWDVRAEIDNRVLTRHCSSWHGVERLYERVHLASRQRA